MLLFRQFIDPQVTVACSGGPDSMALLHFCRRGRKEITVLHFKHGDSYFSRKSLYLVQDYCEKYELPLRVEELPHGSEAEWHDMRSSFYKSTQTQVVTGHTLDDAIEWYMLSAFRGNPVFMPITNGNVFRPMLATDRSLIRDYADRNKVPYVIDPTNVGRFNDRAKLRLHLPMLLADFPQLAGTLRNHYDGKFKELCK